MTQLLLAQPETSIYPALCHAINRWLWRWSPWHLRHDLRVLNRELSDRTRTLMDTRRRVFDLQQQVLDMEKWVKEVQPPPLVPLPKMKLTSDEDLAFKAKRFTISAKEYRFVVREDDLVHQAVRLDHIRRMMVDKYLAELRPMLERDLVKIGLPGA